MRSPHGSLFLNQGSHPVSSADLAPPAYHLGCDKRMQGSSFQCATLAAPRASCLIILRFLLFFAFQSRSFRQETLTVGPCFSRHACTAREFVKEASSMKATVGGKSSILIEDIVNVLCKKLSNCELQQADRQITALCKFGFPEKSEFF